MRSVLVHFDFKGLPLSSSHICAIFGRLKALGATGVLLEWEDMLPYTGEYERLAAPHAYSANEVANIVSLAERIGLEVVPLVQTLGHLEFALKQDHFKMLREDPDDWSTLCPVRPESAAFVKELIAQVLAHHPRSTRVHIGCDEPTLGVASREAIDSHVDGASGVLVEHVQRTCAAVRELCRPRTGGATARVGALMWHDAACEMSDACLGRLLESGVQCVCWDYRPQLESSAPSLVFAERLLARGSAVYVATAYKGAETSDAVVPNRDDRASNQRAWRAWFRRNEALESASGTGVVLTGWSRFGHLMPLTEPFPAGWSSLVTALTLWTTATSDEEAEVALPAQLIPGTLEQDEPAAAFAQLCDEVAGLRREVDALETEHRLSLPPATARQAAPKLRITLRARAEGLAARLAAIDARLAHEGAPVALAGVLFRGTADLDEWRAAKVREPLRRAQQVCAACCT